MNVIVTSCGGGPAVVAGGVADGRVKNRKCPQKVGQAGFLEKVTAFGSEIVPGTGVRIVVEVPPVGG